MGWTSAQTDAINTKDKTILVSAAAGSGKTTTLTERIIRSITRSENASDIDRLLIVTFTKAAATDLKNKISRELTKRLAEDPKNKYLSRQMIKLGSADICTIDSFYYKAVKENLDSLGMPMRLKMMDECESRVMKNGVMADVIDFFYEKEDRGGDFWTFMDVFCDSRGESSAVYELTGLYDKLNCYPEGIEFLRENADMLQNEAKLPFLETRAGKTVSDICESFFTHAHTVYSDAIKHISADETAIKKYGAAFEYDYKHFDETYDAIREKDYAEAKRLFDEYQRISPSNARCSDQVAKKYGEYRDDCINRYKKLKDTFFSSDEAQCKKDALDASAFCRVAYDVLSEFDSRFTGEKKSRGVCDFSDLKRFALKLFIGDDGNPTPLAVEYSNRYDEIYIDEYQDTDLVQDQIFAAISRGNNRFMVGDIKQSIYRFRGANPSVFAGYKKTFPPLCDSENAENCSIYMSENFRCDKPVIDFTNLVCGHLFSMTSDSIGYKPENDDLVFKKEILPDDREMAQVTLSAVKSYGKNALAKFDGDERKKYEGNGRELEARYVASRINAILSDKAQTCEDGKSRRCIEPRDIAVLVPSNGDAEVFAKALISCGIPTLTRGDAKYFDNPEVLIVVSLLYVIDNPRKDVFLAGVLRSPLFGLDVGELIEIRNISDGKKTLFDDVLYASENIENDEIKAKLSLFLAKLALYREKARELTVDKLIRFIYSDTMILSFAGLSSDDDVSTAERRANLLLLYDLARKFESGSYKGLYSFISYINDIIESGEKIERPASDANTNVVKVMTIHASKGLEFPICFISALDKTFTSRGKSPCILFDHSVGIGAELGHESGFAAFSNSIFSAVKEKINAEEREERIRILYVALTRAREKLYLSAKIENEDKVDTNSLCVYSDKETVLSKNSYLDFIIHALSSNGKELETHIIEPYEVPQTEIIHDTSAKAEENTDGDREECIYEKISEHYAFEYPYSYLSRIPAKLSVSKLYPAVLDSAEDDGREGNISLSELPRFLIPKEDRASAADRGTATHVFMQFCDFDNAKKNGAEAELARLCDMGLIPRESASLIRLDWLAKFLDGDLCREISSSKRVFREKRFHIKLPATDFTANAELGARLEGETVTVQGIIDIVFEDADGNLVLCDYKTDYLTEDERRCRALAEKKLADRHREQLSYYSEAVRQIFGKAPARVCIYSLPLGDTIDIT